ARSRLLRRPPLSAIRQPWRHRLLGAGRNRAQKTAPSRRSEHSPHRRGRAVAAPRKEDPARARDRLTTRRMPASHVRTFLTGAALILPDRVATGQTLVIEDGRIGEIISGPRPIGTGETRIDIGGGFIAPGFIDVHVHGVHGTDVLDGPGAVATVAGRLPRW